MEGRCNRGETLVRTIGDLRVAVKDVDLRKADLEVANLNGG